MSYIPSGLFDIYYSYVDDFNNSLGVSCELSYPPVQVACSCTDNVGNKSINRYHHGGPAPINFGGCALCGGQGYKESSPSTDTIKLRIYENPKDWIKVGVPVNVSNNTVQIIGFASDLPKYNQAIKVEINTPQQGHGVKSFDKAGDVSLHGFGKTRYFIAYLNKTG